MKPYQKHLQMKKFSKFIRDYNEDDYDHYTDKKSVMETREHKKDKKLQRLFKTKNYNELVEFLEDDV